MDTPEYRMAIVDLRIPFWRLVAFFVKSTLAMIPAVIILAVIGGIVAFAVGLLLQFLGFGNLGLGPRRFSL